MKAKRLAFVAVFVFAASFSCRPRVANVNDVGVDGLKEVAAVPFNLRINFSGLIAFVPQPKAGPFTRMWALLVRTNENEWRPPMCRDVGKVMHYPGIRVRVRFLSPDAANDPGDAMAVVPIDGDDIKFEYTSICDALPAFHRDADNVAEISAFAPKMSTVCERCSTDKIEDVDY